MGMSKPYFDVSRRTLLGGTLAAASAVPLLSGSALAQMSGAGRNPRTDKRPVIHPDGPRLGAYDPWGDFADDRRVATEHLFLPWEDVDLGGLAQADNYAAARGRGILITIEPWSWAKDWNVSRTELRNIILSGQRDQNLRAILKVIAGFRRPVTIRWGQEMDNPYGRFTWAGWEPADYIAAYKRMAGIIREMLPKAQLMWSPKGEKNLASYYPGSQYVDVVGLTVFGLERFDVLQFGQARFFAEALKQGYDLTVGYGKPIWVAELGYDGSREYLVRWMNDITRKFPQFPALKQVVYFNDKEVWPWPRGLGLPDWRVVPGRQSNYPQRSAP